MNVLFVLDGLWVGGTERSMAEMLPRLAELGIRPTFACLRHRSEGVEDEVRTAGIEVVILPGTSLPAQVRSLRRLLAERRPALVHSALFRSNLVARLASVGTGIPLLNSLVNDSYGPERLADPGIRPWRLRLVQGIDALTGRLLADHFHAVSESVAEAASRRLAIPAGRITVVRRGRDPKRLPRPGHDDRARARRGLGIPDDTPVLVTVGRQEYQKGHRVLLEAAGCLRPRWPGLVILVAGRRGHATVELEALHARLGLGPAVRFLGHRQDVPEILAAADLFVFPSLYEGLPGALIEALASALPVVASNIPGVREVVRAGENALLVPPERPAELAAAVGELLGDPGRAAAFGEESRRIFEAEHTLERAITGMVRLYDELIGEGSGDGA